MCLKFNAVCTRESLCDEGRRDTKRAKAAESLVKANKKPTFGPFIPGNARDSEYIDKPGYGGSHSLRKKAIKYPWQVAGVETFGQSRFRAFYGNRRHEYSDIPFQSYTGKAAHIAHKDLGKAPTVRRIAGLGWSIVVNTDTGEVIRTRPRTHAEKLQQLADMYMGKTIFDPTKADYAEIEKRIMAQVARNRGAMRQAEDRCHRIGKPKSVTIVNVVNTKRLEAAMGGSGLKRVKEILAEADRYKTQQRWVRGLYKEADDKLTAAMLEQHAKATVEAIALDAKLLTRPGISRVHDEYIIDPDVFLSEFAVGDIVTSDKFGAGTIIKITGVFLTVRPAIKVGRHYFGHSPTRTVPDWEVKKKVGRLARFWKWATTPLF